MKKLTSVSQIALLGVFLPVAMAFAANNKTVANEKTAVPTTGVNWSAQDSSLVNNKTHILKLYGKARLSYKSFKVTANYIEFDQLEKTGKAMGDVVIYKKDGTITGKTNTSTFDLKSY